MQGWLLSRWESAVSPLAGEGHSVMQSFSRVFRKKKGNLGSTSCMILVLGLMLGSSLSASSNNQLSSAVTVRFEGDYPWLVQGATADYISVNVGDPPHFITSSGQLLMLAPAKPGTPVINDGFGEGVASLNWTVASRTGNDVLLNVSFHASGCQDNETAYMVANQTAAPCTSYNFSTTISVLVNVTSDEASVGGINQGMLNFWEPPLLENESVESGSVIINQQQFISVANVGAPFESTGLILPGGTAPVDVSGMPYTSPIRSSTALLINIWDQFSITKLAGSSLQTSRCLERFMPTLSVHRASMTSATDWPTSSACPSILSTRRFAHGRPLTVSWRTFLQL